MIYSLLKKYIYMYIFGLQLTNYKTKKSPVDKTF